MYLNFWTEGKNNSSKFELDQEIGKVIRLGSFSEVGKRPNESENEIAGSVEEIMTRKGKLANDTEFKDI
ncbi:hypothetical protein E2C01_050359 [Portunus trituberculatus]|uniref:Uncharacterized protein n=1 Tax=Portunus trituberculatus TaxID=210409 RepID=A0A5B7GFW5_PORTR|nr:hypothetical protein [Portunus trituberculatus]